MIYGTLCSEVCMLQSIINLLLCLNQQARISKMVPIGSVVQIYTSTYRV